MGIPKGEREGSPHQVPSSSSEAIMQSQRAHSNTSYLPRAQSQQIPPTFGIPHMKLGEYIHITGSSHQRGEQWLLVDSLFSKQRSGVGHRNTSKGVTGSVRHFWSFLKPRLILLKAADELFHTDNDLRGEKGILCSLHLIVEVGLVGRTSVAARAPE